MKRLIPTGLVLSITLAAAVAHAAVVNYSVGAHGGFMPSAGGNLHSSSQEQYFNTTSGIDGINKSMDGYSTSEIKRLLAVSAGLEVRALFFDYFYMRLAGNYTRSVWGGDGKTLYDNAGIDTLKCRYALTMYDVPLTLGLSIPFWKDVKISFSCGMAFGYGIYTNRFENGAGTVIRGSFSGYAFPLVLLVESEYFLTEKLALNTSLSYYKGTTSTIKDGKRSDGDVDFSRIDFTGYRFSFGIAYYFYSI